MTKKGLTRQHIIEKAQLLIEQNGLAAFSLRALASSLDIRVSSLYNHISGRTELLTEVGLCALHRLVQAEEAAVAGRSSDDALFALADAYRGFALEHPELYRILMRVHMLDLPVLEQASAQIVAPILRVLESCGLSGEQQMHYQRLLRSVMHGFFAHENSGGFTQTEVNRDESYRLAIECIAAGLHAAVKEGQY